MEDDALFRRNLERLASCHRASGPPSESWTWDQEALEEGLSDGYFELEDGCVVEPDATCPHGLRSPLLRLGLI